MATHFFRFKTPNKNPPKQVHAISMAHHPPSIPRNKSRRHMNPVVNSNFLSFNSPQFSTSEITTSKVYWSPKARFLIAFSNYFYKVIKFSPWVSLNVNRTTISLIIMGYKIPGLTHLLVLGRQGKHVWLIGSYPWRWRWDAPLTLLDLAEAICMYAKIWFLAMSSLIHKVGFCLANIFSSKMFGCHCQLVTVDWSVCWMCVVVFPRFIIASKN